MSQIRVGVLRGGISSEYPVSLKTGEAVLSNLNDKKYKATDIFIDRDGVWHIGGFPVKPERASREVDVMFNALHGEYGEDGKVQRELEMIRMPYTGSRVIPSAVAMNKGLAKHCFSFYGIKTPRGVTVRREDDMHSVLLPFFREVSGHHVVKPLNGGSSLGVVITSSFEELITAVESLLQEHHAAIIEEFIAGRELTCGVVDGLRGNAYPLFPIEIIHNNTGNVWDYESKYNGRTLEICPANLDERRFREVQKIAVDAHRRLGLRHYSRADFIVSPKGIYLLEVNSLPGLTTESLIPKALYSADLTFPDFLDYLVTLALTKK